jgi:hypothetical protein
MTWALRLYAATRYDGDTEYFGIGKDIADDERFG